MGLLLGWLADHYNRKWIISIGITAWSVMTAICGLSRSYSQLFLARIGVAVGEAALSPSAYSMLAEYLDRRTLPRAMGVYTFGIFLGVGLAYIVGGEVVAALEVTPEITLPLVGTLRSWQGVFLAVGLPGLLVALWISTVREPARQHRKGALRRVVPLHRTLARDVDRAVRRQRLLLRRLLRRHLVPGTVHPHLGLGREAIGPRQWRVLDHRRTARPDIRWLVLEPSDVEGTA